MKKIVFAFFLSVALAAQATSSPIVNEKILKAFTRTFIYAKEVRWHETEDFSYAYFSQDSIRMRADYDQKGHLLSTMRYYSEKQLVPSIAAELKDEYRGASIFYVTEVSIQKEIIYFVMLRDDNFWYTVKSDESGNLEETEKYERGDK